MGQKQSSEKIEDSLRPNLPAYRTGISHQLCDPVLKDLRKKAVGTMPGQSYSFLQSCPFDFDQKGDSKIDLCVLGNVPKVFKKNSIAKPCMDEAVVVNHDGDWTTICVLDGHGAKDGGNIAKCVIVRLVDLLLNKKYKVFKDGKSQAADPALNKDLLLTSPKTFFQCLVENLHNTILDGCDFASVEAGTTATMASFSKKKLHLSWVGDSKAVLFVGAKDDFSDLIPYNVTSMHNLKTEEEKERIRTSGGVVGGLGGFAGRGKAGPPRVFKSGQDKPGLNLSKALGDSLAQSVGVTHVPDYLEIDFSKIVNFEDLSDQIPPSFNSPDADIPPLAANSAVKKNGIIASLHSLRQRISSMSSTLSAQTANPKEEKTVNNRVSERRIQSPANNASIRMVEKSGNLSAFEDISGFLDNKKDSSGPIKDASFTRLATSPDADSLSNKTKLSRVLNLAPDNMPIKHALLIVATDGVWTHFPKEKVAKHLGIIMRDNIFHHSNRETEPRVEKDQINFNISREICLKAQQLHQKALTSNLESTDDITAVATVLF